jgi:preprotein translocase subunit Sec61beta
VAKKDKFTMPSGMAGLVRYGDESKSQIKVKPKYVIILCIALTAMELLLRFFG